MSEETKNTKPAHQILIDEEKCIGCGLCRKDCPGNNIVIEDEKARILHDKCIFCGHCEAICPQKAVSVTGFADEPEAFEADTRLDPDTLLAAIRTRRSVRSFTDQPVPKKALKQIIEAGRLAPTACNYQKTTFVILDRKKDEMEAQAVGMFRKLLNAGKPISSALKNMELDDHFFFKKAPIAIVIASPDKVSASLAAENMAFMAEAHGLGVLFSGFFTAYVNTNPKVRARMKLKPGYKAVTTLVIGYPAVKYRRTARREDADLRIL